MRTANAAQQYIERIVVRVVVVIVGMLMIAAVIVFHKAGLGPEPEQATLVVKRDCQNGNNATNESGKVTRTGIWRGLPDDRPDAIQMPQCTRTVPQ